MSKKELRRFSEALHELHRSYGALHNDFHPANPEQHLALVECVAIECVCADWRNIVYMRAFYGDSDTKLIARLRKLVNGNLKDATRWQDDPDRTVADTSAARERAMQRVLELVDSVLEK